MRWALTRVSIVCAILISQTLAQVAGRSTAAPRPVTCLVDYDWSEDDVPNIITPEERAAFRQLKNEEERGHFIQLFWLRHDPTPDSIANEFRDEYYRRILYANQHFSSQSVSEPVHGIQLIVAGVRFPSPRNKDLEEVVSHRVRYTVLPFNIDFKFNPVTSGMVQVPIRLTFQRSRLKWIETDGDTKARIQAFGRLTNPTGWIVQVFEVDETVSSETASTDDEVSVSKTVYMPPGTYQLELAAKEIGTDQMGTRSEKLEVPGCPRKASK